MKSSPADTSERQSMLDRLKSKHVDAPPLPDVDSSAMTNFDQPLDKFIEMLSFAGGKGHVVQTLAEAREILDQIDVFRDASNVVSLVPDCVEGTIDASSIDDPHALSIVDWTIAKGEFMVAENGAIWIDGKTLPHRVLVFIAQYLAIIVLKSEIVSNMHQAYERMEDHQGRYGVFVSGPSKTADIEQSLVLGAHGCRELQVFVVADL